MAEYNQLGVLAALLLFAALTAKDIYLGRSSPQRGQVTPANLHRDAVPAADSAPPKPGVEAGPVIRFRYW